MAAEPNHTPSVWFPRRRRVSITPWFPRFVRIKSLPHISEGRPNDHYTPLDDTEAWDHLTWTVKLSVPEGDERYDYIGQYPEGTQVQRIEADNGMYEDLEYLQGWQLYWVPTEPIHIGRLKDEYEIYPLEHDDQGNRVPKIAWGRNTVHGMSPPDRVRNFDGWYAVKMSNPSGSIHVIVIRSYLILPLPRY